MNILTTAFTGSGSLNTDPFYLNGNVSIVIPSGYNGTATVLGGVSTSLQVTYDDTSYSVYEDGDGNLATLTDYDVHLGLQFNGRTKSRVTLAGGDGTTVIPAVIIKSDIGAFAEDRLDEDELDDFYGQQAANTIVVNIGNKTYSS